MNVIDNPLEATIAVDGVSLLIMAGIIFYSRLYRKRGRLEDRVFFNMCIVNIALSLFDILAIGIDLLIPGQTGWLGQFFNSMFYACMYAFSFLLFWHTYCRGQKGDKTLKEISFFSIPLAVGVGLIVLNIITHFAFYIDPATGTYYEGGLGFLLYLVPLFYFILFCVFMARIDVGDIWLFAGLLFIRVAAGYILNEAASTSILFAITLVFVHMQVMRVPFYEEEVE